jgi:hypothetical protein
MTNKLGRSILAGFVATAVMTVLMLMAPMMAMPEMNPADMMSGMLGVSPLLAKGLLYGFIVFAFTRGMMFLMSRIMPMPSNVMKDDWHQ